MSLFLVSDGHRFGYADAHGALVIAPRYTRVPIADGWRFVDGLALAYDGPKKMTYIDRSGEFAFPGRWDSARPFAGGRAAVADKKKGLYRWGYIGSDGMPVTPLAWFKAGAFADGRAFVEREPGSGLELVDAMGQRVGTACFAGSNNAMDLTMRAHPFTEGLAGVADAETKLWGFVDADGAWVLPPVWKAVRPFAEGLACVQHPDDTVAFVDHTGHEAFRWGLPYLALGAFAEGLVLSPNPADSLAKEFLDHDGRVVLPARREHASGFSNGRALYRLSSGYCGFVDRGGAVVIEPRYLDAQPFVDGLARVVPDPKKPGRFGYIDVDGRMVIPPA